MHILCKIPRCINNLSSSGKRLCQFNSTLSSTTSPTSRGFPSVLCQSLWDFSQPLVRSAQLATIDNAFQCHEYCIG